MIKFFSADYIVPVTQQPIVNGVVSVTEAGEIVGIFDSKDAKELRGQEIKHHKGIIVPGFINSHCHLELSHLHGKVEQKQGLIPFISSILEKKTVENATALQAIEKADKTMYDNGIVAVGDICNTSLTKATKTKSQLYYHNYIEMIGFDPNKVESVVNNALNLQQEFDSLPTSLVPHAPYSVCKDLFRNLRQVCRDNENILTIHNQESEEENKFYRYKKGAFVDFYESLNQDIEFFKPQARDSIQSVIPLFPKKQRLTLVHNIYTGLKDVSFINRLGREITWCFCPNANLYIENKLPKLDLFVSSGVTISLGTDSLASNNKLCILSELKTIAKHFPTIPFTTSIAWATLNGAMHLGIERKYGSLEVGKRPGLNLITKIDGLALTTASEVKKLI